MSKFKAGDLIVQDLTDSDQFDASPRRIGFVLYVGPYTPEIEARFDPQADEHLSELNNQRSSGANWFRMIWICTTRDGTTKMHDVNYHGRNFMTWNVVYRL